jgi:hypothetical protein
MGRGSGTHPERGNRVSPRVVSYPLSTWTGGVRNIELGLLYTPPYVGTTLNHPGRGGPAEVESVSLAHHQQDLRVTVQALGWWPNGRFQPLADDIASVAYWYQRRPHAGFAEFPRLEQQWPR